MNRNSTGDVAEGAGPMQDDPPPPVRLTPKAAEARDERLTREAAALRENLRRRKAQERARDIGPDGGMSDPA